ncbi:hypothetical protein HGG72_08335 [Ochrobactrum pecoris]|uniref:Uncharacterized protein n=1 Tax=Brucella pecoris TaxID=867683 RepID=A0A5C5CRX9_9HYPH|nr:hypothetical protein [Brucella pecoris]KAB2699354.1 hypothetical protein F9K79_09680 [Ochrobactrum sp. Kaboul]MBB4092433.1 hypothetical protein [Brucella pecoris]NKW80347.1 hypothetical protein [Brucella pecoris]TNV14279.1 hypothetical protein FIB18_03300 [Brucella pecoris]
MFIVAWSINHGGNNIEDHWIVAETRKQADAEAAKLQKIGNLHCWAVSEIKAGSEPHWIE